ncbi:hypothetical protein LEP1GSC133_2259 [Leptospira borgpetersenii serovar Pomona str. 200901868]|uniref:Uncharacterized protein n=1 Tax=Leptospira borgpetersenii serovar Pomona str. 200901868 TaxID=1192866 RepID=M6W279_LEPBO|nr:hypothetical protein LEP1GSC133_2259 [Leptospira borgpetersenii serovar Pomona str. 200901868]
MTAKKAVNLLGKKVQALIEAKGDSQKEAAVKLKLTPTGLNGIVQGRVESASHSFLSILKEEYKPDFNWLLNDSVPVLPIKYLSPEEEDKLVSKADQDKVLLSQIKTTKGLREIIQNLLKFSNQKRKVVGDMIAEFSKNKN